MLAAPVQDVLWEIKHSVSINTNVLLSGTIYKKNSSGYGNMITLDGHEPNRDFICLFISALDKMAENHQMNYKLA